MKKKKIKKFLLNLFLKNAIHLTKIAENLGKTGITTAFFEQIPGT